MIKKSLFLLFTGGLFLWGSASFAAPTGMFATSLSKVAPIEETRLIEINPASLKGSFQTAAICFLGDGCGDDAGFNSADTNYNMDSENQCKQEGYSNLSCNSAQQVSDLCPYNSAFGRSCVCRPDLVTCAAGQTGVGPACGGKYASCSCPTNFQYTSSNCTSPRSLSGTTCGGKYSACSCPTGVSTGSFGCKEYYPSPCGSVCKVANTNNCHNRVAVTALYGCMSYFADCPSKCERAYPDNCRNRTAATATHGCQTYWADCSSKCQTAYGDNCRNQTAVTVPTNGRCSTYFSDCSSKCSDWTCNAGFTNWCTAPITDCNTLGYSKSAYQCLNGYIKCPFDAGKVYCKD